MKTHSRILALVVGLGSLGFFGCATSVRHPAPVNSTPVVRQNIQEESDDSMAEDSSEDASAPGAKANPTALAHFAAGVSYERNDEDDLAIKEFDEAALADPSNERLVIRVAQRFLKSKQVDKAVTVLAKSTQRKDASGLIWSWLARAYLQAGRTRQALSASRAAVERQPDAFDGYESEIEIYFRENQWGDAARALNRAAKSVRPDPQTLVALGSLYSVYLKSQSKDAVTRGAAVALLDRVANMKFSSIRLWQNLADLYNQVGRPKKAIAVYAKLLSEAPEPSVLRDSLHERLAGIYFQQDDRTNATKQLQAIVRDNPTRYPRAWFFLGELAVESDQLADASDDYENAVRWDPNMEEAYYKLALVQIGLHHADDAFKTLEIARARFPKTFLCEFYTGVAYLDVKNYREAIRHFDTAEVIALATDAKRLDYRFYFQFGEACERNQDYKRAEEYLQKCINLSPDYGDALNYLGYMLADRGEQLPHARLLLEKAVKLEPKNGAFLDSLGWVLFKQKQPQQALPWLLKAVEYSPGPDATVLDHLGEVYMALHQAAKAVESWKKSLSIESNPDVKKKLDLYTGGV